jgi:hypothetical protein
MVLCAMMIGFVSCEPTTLGKKNVLINLAELGNEMQSLAHMEQMLQRKGFIKIHEEVEETEEYVDGTFVYTNNIQLDSTLVTAADKIRLQTENATILTVNFYGDEHDIEAMLYACYILPEETTESYKTISNNLYHYYSDKFSYTLYENTDNLSQEYRWYGFIDEKEYNNKDEHYTYIFNKGAITKEEYDKKMADAIEETDGFRKDFVAQIKEPEWGIHESIVASSYQANHEIVNMTLLTMSDENQFSVTEVPIVECLWMGNNYETLDVIKNSNIQNHTAIRDKIKDFRVMEKFD